MKVGDRMHISGLKKSLVQTFKSLDLLLPKPMWSQKFKEWSLRYTIPIWHWRILNLVLGSPIILSVFRKLNCLFIGFGTNWFITNCIPQCSFGLQKCIRIWFSNTLVKRWAESSMSGIFGVYFFTFQFSYKAVQFEINHQTIHISIRCSL